MRKKTVTNALSIVIRTIVIVSIMVAGLMGCVSTPDRYPTASSPQINRSPTGKQSYPRLSIEGNTEFIVSTGPDGKVTSISARDQEVRISGFGLGGYAACPGTHILRLELGPGERYEVDGVLFIGIRADSPRFYDFGFVALTSADEIPRGLLKERSRLLSLGTDSLFARPDFQFSKTLVWFGKIERLPDGTDRIIGW